MDPPRQFSGGTFDAIIIGAIFLAVCYAIVWPGTRTLIAYYRCKFFHEHATEWTNSDGHHFRCSCGKEWDT